MKSFQMVGQPTLFDVPEEVSSAPDISRFRFRLRDETGCKRGGAHNGEESSPKSSAVVAQGSRPHIEGPRRRKTSQRGTLYRLPRKRGPSVWVYRYFEMINGRRKRRSRIIGTVLEYPTRSAAFRASLHLQMQANSELTKPNITFGCLIDLYMDQCIRPALKVPLGGMTRSPGGRLDYSAARDQRSHINCHIRSRWGHYVVRDFEQPEIRASAEDWFGSLLDPPYSYAGPTVEGISNTMKDLFKFAVKRNYMSVNPFSEGRIELPPGCSKRAKVPLVLSPHQFKLLVSNLSLREKLAVTLAALVAPRASEIFGLQWQDIDFDEGRIVFRRGLREGRVSELKNEASRTDSAAAPEILELFRSWYCRTAYNNQANWVFASPHRRGGLPFWPSGIMRNIQAVAIALGLPKIGWHVFRHSAASWAKKARLNLEEIRILLRHQTVDMAAAVYGKVELEQKKQIQRQLITFVNEEASLTSGRGQENDPNLTPKKKAVPRKVPRMLELKLG